MKNTNQLSVFATLVFGVVVAISSSNSAWAGSVGVSGPTPAPSPGLDVYTFDLDPTGMVGGFDTIELIVNSAGIFNQPAALGVIPPSDDSGFNGLLDAPPLFGGFGYSAFGVTDTTSEVSGTFASLGSNGISNQGSLFIAQVVVPTGGTGSFQYSLFDDGSSTASGSGSLGGAIPEPSAMVLAMFGMIGIAASRRRK